MAIGIACSGSGVLFPGELGALHYIYEKVLPLEGPPSFAGTSGGAMVAAGLAAGMTPQSMLEIAQDLLPRKLMRINWDIWRPRSLGLFSLEALEDVLAKYLPATFAQTLYPLTVVAADVDTQTSIYFSTEFTPSESLPLAVTASCAVPFLFRPIKIREMLLVDGGICNNFPMDVFKDEKVIGVRVSNDPAITPMINSTQKSYWDVESRVDYCAHILGCMMSEIEKKHREDAPNSRVISVRLPYQPFDLFGIERTDIDKMFSIGYQTAKEHFENV
jgi:NTE family protein